MRPSRQPSGVNTARPSTLGVRMKASSPRSRNKTLPSRPCTSYRWLRACTTQPPPGTRSIRWARVHGHDELAAAVGDAEPARFVGIAAAIAIPGHDEAAVDRLAVTADIGIRQQHQLAGAIDKRHLPVLEGTAGCRPGHPDQRRVAVEIGRIQEPRRDHPLPAGVDIAVQRVPGTRQGRVGQPATKGAQVLERRLDQPASFGVQQSREARGALQRSSRRRSRRSRCSGAPRASLPLDPTGHRRGTRCSGKPESGPRRDRHRGQPLGPPPPTACHPPPDQSQGRSPWPAPVPAPRGSDPRHAPHHGARIFIDAGAQTSSTPLHGPGSHGGAGRTRGCPWWCRWWCWCGHDVEKL